MSSPFPPPPLPPLVAILRGLPPEQAAAVGSLLYAAGFRCLEVPLNRPGALQSLRRLRDSLPADALLGAGTVLEPADVARVAEAGGQLVIAPNLNLAVVAAARAAGLLAMPGVATPSEAFTALAAGATVLKAFPGEQVTPAALKAWRTVLPQAPIYPVGGVTLDNLAAYHAAGASGVGIGSALYNPELPVAQLASRAAGWVTAWTEIRRGLDCSPGHAEGVLQ
ncbi:2-dehydro-3-deoxyphosphogalactonate aldolase [Paucibacter oligotrophus]|uniref:2-dehydro-3-deoxyphosphogalactonate aldolase n=1 Tax=Roseateles oligotrophus TaxID=1769250 RepID=A0A840LC25_9BURK|nr:2-dehydro-3-deoxy-6-phosphogalactonate aldolase [Roseateles oligotrophus]MBB4843639.1 2-dehydro-3-deoxyphosphogalactonate aldolase [Roseateles oligotrophus]